MKLLILGGTVFLGRHIVQSALDRGHDVTIFTRGMHNPDVFPDVEKLRGDRKEDLSPLRGRTWDAVIDTCGYVPRVVRNSAELLADSVGHYTFISSVSVYSDVSTPGMDESGPVGTLEDETTEEVTGETYGPLKALCEQAAETAMPGRTLVIRPGLIVGPYDPSDRFTYWVHRIDQGGTVLAPGTPEHLTQIIDVRDLAEWNVRMAESGATGVYNATGPDEQLTMGTLLDACVQISDSGAELEWVSEAFLEEHNVAPWSEMPLWLPETPEYAGFDAIDCSKAIKSGLTFRSLQETIGDTLAWDRALPERELRAGISREREAELLRAWKESVDTVKE
jgi:2'-hydroxyisoflavone reductase